MDKSWINKYFAWSVGVGLMKPGNSTPYFRNRPLHKVPRIEEAVFGYRAGIKGKTIHTDRRMGTTGIFASIDALDGAIGFTEITEGEFIDYTLYRTPNGVEGWISTW